MKKFIRIMAIVAAALVAASLLMMLVSLPFQRVIAGKIFGAPEETLGFLPQLPVIPFIFCMLQLGCVALLIICSGNQKGGIWLELIVFAALVIVLPSMNRLASMLYTTMVANVRGVAFLSATSVISNITNYCLVPASIGQALAYAVCGMSVVYKKMNQKIAE